jgi:hypothetical protein
LERDGSNVARALDPLAFRESRLGTSAMTSSYSEAGTEVIVGVGPDRARWRCIGYKDGATADIMSLTDDGALGGRRAR